MKKSHRMDGINFWPGYVDAMTNLVLNLLFVLGIFAVTIFVMNLQRSPHSKRETLEQTSIKKKNILKIIFKKNAVSFTENQKKMIKTALQEVTNGRHWKVSAPTSLNDSELKRMAYLRVLATRSALISTGIDMANIEVQLFEYKAEKNLLLKEGLKIEMPIFVDILD
jgi:hypothetical protein